jgi:dTDP-4-amino-4,6-dideoxygalactose transaminase
MQPQDEVIVPSMTYVATAAAVVDAGMYLCMYARMYVCIYV